METITRRRALLNAIALLLLLPALYVTGISLLKYVFGVEGPFDASEPWLEKMGIKESLGWNINLLILLGPVAALLIAVVQVLHLKWHFSREYFQFDITIRRKRTAMAIGMMAILILGSLFAYMIGENCNC